MGYHTNYFHTYSNHHLIETVDHIANNTRNVKLVKRICNKIYTRDNICLSSWVCNILAGQDMRLLFITQKAFIHLFPFVFFLYSKINKHHRKGMERNYVGFDHLPLHHQHHHHFTYPSSRERKI